MSAEIDSCSMAQWTIYCSPREYQWGLDYSRWLEGVLYHHPSRAGIVLYYSCQFVCIVSVCLWNDNIVACYLVRKSVCQCWCGAPLAMPSVSFPDGLVYCPRCCPRCVSIRCWTRCLRSPECSSPSVSPSASWDGVPFPIDPHWMIPVSSDALPNTFWKSTLLLARNASHRTTR